MAFKGLDKWYEKHKAEFYSHVKDNVRALAERPERVTWDEYTSLCESQGMNSYERRILVANFDDEALCKLHDQCATQYRELLPLQLSEHYQDMVCRELAPLLVARLRERNAKADGCYDVGTDVSDDVRAQWAQNKINELP